MSGALRCLILAPTGNDTALIVEALATAGFLPHPCASLEDLCAEITAGAGAVVIAAEAIDGHAAAEIMVTLEDHPVWSMLPFILLTSADAPTDVDIAVVDLFGPRASVSITERPCRAGTLTSAVRSALYARQHQYEVHSLLERLDRQAHDLERSNRDLHRFAYAASHDLQEPLRSIMSYLDLIEQRNLQHLDERSRGFFRHVIEGAGRMRGLIRALLEYGRVSEVSPRMSTFAGADLVNEALHNLHAMIEDAHVTITIGALPTIHADRTLLPVLFQNLIGNAIKYRSAEPRVDITATETATEWIFVIADNGIGIAPHDQERIFDVFQRLHTSDQYKGHGIGLATCKRIADLHGGRLWVESKPGAGSKFFISIRRPG